MRIRVGGSPVSSLETRWLHSDHASALRELREHRRRCVQCERAARKRDEKACDDGQALSAAERDLKARAAEAERLDREPHPDQGALFDAP